MVSIKEVAQAAGVSTGTVSRYFHEPQRVHVETRDRIKHAVDRLGYAPNILARHFRMGSTGVVLVLTSAVGDPFYGDVIAGISRVAADRQYGVRIQEVEQGLLIEGELQRIVASRQVDGIIVLGDAGPFPAARMAADGARPPAIVVCGETADTELLRYPRFQIDGFSAAGEMTDYLMALGHRRIAFMNGEIPMLTMNEREAGYRAAMARAGLPIEDGWLCNGRFTLEGARRGTADLLNARNVPSAIVCANDEMAIGTMAELHSRGLRVPADMSVVGFDDTRYAEVANPPLTTVAQPAAEIGARGMLRLLQAMDGREVEPTVEYLPHKLIVRRSAQAIAP